MGSDSIGNILIIVNEPTDLIEQERTCTKLLAVLIDLSRKLGTYFEPEQELEMRRIDGSKFSYEIYPVFVSAPELAPEPLFSAYVRIITRCFESLLGNQNLPVSILEVERFRGSLLETETERLLSDISSCRKKIKRLGADFDFICDLPEEVFLGGDTAPCVEKMALVLEERDLLIFQNYEFEYELSNLIFNSIKSSRLLIGGRPYEVFFYDDFMTKYLDRLLRETAVVFESEIIQTLPSFNARDFNLQNLSFDVNIPSTLRYKKEGLQVVFSKAFLSKAESLFRLIVGSKIHLKDRHEERKIGDFYKGEFYQRGVRNDRKTCFEFTP